MNTLVLDHYYALGIAWDRTKYRNHGVVYQAPPGAGPYAASLSFAPGRTAPGSAVAVPPSESLASLGAIRVRAEVYLAASTLGHRSNIVEGHLSFAMFVDGKSWLTGTFFDSAGNWVGIRSNGYTVPRDQWCTLEFWYDGISAAELLVNGTRVAATYAPLTGARVGGPAMLGAVRGVGNHGIFIGHWPEADDRYTVNGYIRRVQLFKREDRDDSLLDPCCIGDTQRWLDVATQFKKAGMDADGLRAWVEKLMAVSAPIIDGLRGDDEQKSGELDFAVRQFVGALANRRNGALGPSLRFLMDWIEANGQGVLNSTTANNVQSVLRDFPLSVDETLGLGNEACFSKLREIIEAEVTRRTGKHPPKRNRPADPKTPPDKPKTP